MRALLCKEYGLPEDLVLEEIEAPEIRPEHLRVEVKACGVNYPDLLLIANQYQFRPELPFSPGLEIAGRVLEVGKKVYGFVEGQRVAAFTGWGGFREQVVVKSSRCFPLPDSMDDDTGASFGLAYGTSYHALVDRGGLVAGEALLVHGASGGVGAAAVDIGQLLGARVIVTGGIPAKLERIAEIYGLDTQDLVDTGNEGWKDQVKELTGGIGADVIYDPVGGDVFKHSLRCINWRGRILVIGFASGSIPAAPANLLLLKGCSAVGVFWGTFVDQEPEANRSNFEQLFSWHEDGKLRPHISHRFPLERGAEALRALANREILGKAVLTIS